MLFQIYPTMQNKNDFNAFENQFWKHCKWELYVHIESFPIKRFHINITLHRLILIFKDVIFYKMIRKYLLSSKFTSFLHKDDNLVAIAY